MSTFLDIARLVGIIIFCVSVCISLDAIAKQLKRIADAGERPGGGPLDPQR